MPPPLDFSVSAPVTRPGSGFHEGNHLMTLLNGFAAEATLSWPISLLVASTLNQPDRRALCVSEAAHLAEELLTVLGRR